MANFLQAYSITLHHEGGYVDDPNDRGQETYKGISRRAHPNWAGWTIVDRLKPDDGDINVGELNAVFEEDVPLQEQVQALYKQQYWDKVKGDNIPNQALANELFDTAVNMGVKTAVKFLQDSLNIWNRNQKDYPDITVDGVFGNQTLSTLMQHLTREKGDASLLTHDLNIQQGARYRDIMKRNPSQERFARGWMKRTR